MKNLMIALVLIFGASMVHAQKPATTAAPAAKMEKKEAKPDMSAEKEHVCTAACKDGKHVYAHGEKGHKCTAACHTAPKAGAKKAAAKPAEKPEPKK